MDITNMFGYKMIGTVPLWQDHFREYIVKLGISQKKFITHFTKPEEIMAKRRPDKKLDFQGNHFGNHLILIWKPQKLNLFLSLWQRKPVENRCCKHRWVEWRKRTCVEKNFNSKISEKVWLDFQYFTAIFLCSWKAFLSFLARLLSNLSSGTCWCAEFLTKHMCFRMNHFKRKFSNFRNKPSTPTIPERTIRIDDHTLESGKI